MAIINRIDAKPNIANAITGIAYSKKRVAAYARVSTEQDEHSNSKSRNHVWFCNAKYKHDKPCGSPTLREDALKQAFLTAANSLLGDKTVYIKHLRKIIADIDNDDSLEEQLTAEEITYAEAVSELRTLIEINAHRSQDQQAYMEEFEKLDLRYKESEAKISQLK